ncbi:MAG: aspartate carbamoyltransferase regulatory subunit [Gammaproteobacteria bacterium]
MMEQTLSVSAIYEGTVIDHIKSGLALRIIRLLKLAETNHQMTIGLHLKSKRLKSKDIIKIENKIITQDEADQITLFAPDATINVIKNYKVERKIESKLPQAIHNVFICPNKNCISRSEPVESFFNVLQWAKHVLLNCKFCEKNFDSDELLAFYG